MLSIILKKWVELELLKLKFGMRDTKRMQDRCTKVSFWENSEVLEILEY